jgi:anti-sigma factor RsiW
MTADDPWLERLSEYLDDELEPSARSACATHLAVCEECRTLLADLRRLRDAARALPARAPTRELWPGIESELTPSARAQPRPRWLLPFAAGVIVTLGALLAFRTLGSRASESERVARAGEHYLLLLHEPAGFGSGSDAAAHAALVARYERWATELGPRCAGGEELETDGLELRPGAAEPAPSPAAPRVGGYFLLDVEDREEAVALARTCPHLGQGGWIELRRIRTR